ncbi:HXXEE domain-containing protein [Pyxidicoccus sp. 3LG]
MAFALHNLEEALWLPDWSQAAGSFHHPVGAAEFRFAVAVLTTGGVLLTALAQRRGGRGFLALTGLWGVMLLNVVFPHLLATVALSRYAPGLGTALLLILPVNVYLLRRAFREQALTPGRFVGAVVVVGVVLLAAIPMLFWLGRHLFPA